MLSRQYSEGVAQEQSRRMCQLVYGSLQLVMVEKLRLGSSLFFLFEQYFEG